MPQTAKTASHPYEGHESQSPMAKKIRMPALPGQEDGRLVRWLVTEGQRVTVGDTIAEIETPNATHEIETTAEGQVEYILIPAGPNVVSQGTPLVLIVPVASQPADNQKADGDNPPVVQVSAGRDPRAVPEEESLVTTPEEQGPMHTATYREALGAVVTAEMRRQPQLFVIGHDVRQTPGADDVMQGLAEEFGEERVITASVAEDATAGLAIGAALGGLRPLVVFSSWTAGRTALMHIMETLSHISRIGQGDIPLPVVFRAPANEGNDAAAAWLSLLPGLSVAAPSTPAAAQGLLRSALRGSGPIAIIESPKLYATSGEVPDDSDAVIQPGQAHIALAGSDVTVAAHGRHVQTALKAAEKAAGEDVSTEVIDLMTLAPLDAATLTRSVTKTGRLLTLEDAGSSCTIGHRIVSTLAETALAEMKRAPICIDEAILFARSSAGDKRPTDIIAGLITALKDGSSKA